MYFLIYGLTTAMLLDIFLATCLIHAEYDSIVCIIIIILCTTHNVIEMGGISTTSRIRKQLTWTE